MNPIDFTLPRDQGDPLTFDASWRAGAGRDGAGSVLAFYRGHW